MCSCYRWLGQNNQCTEEQVDFLVSQRGSVKTIQAESQSQIYLVACIDDTIVAVAAVKANELTKLFVDPDYHHRRIGTSLFESAQSAVQKAGHKEIITGVMADSAIGFYEKMGMAVFNYTISKTKVFSGYKIPIMKKTF